MLQYFDITFEIYRKTQKRNEIMCFILMKCYLYIQRNKKYYATKYVLGTFFYQFKMGTEIYCHNSCDNERVLFLFRNSIN